MNPQITLSKPDFRAENFIRANGSNFYTKMFQCYVLSIGQHHEESYHLFERFKLLLNISP